jgi:glutathione synthase/RimK-type ligase-like ATP-grasp enzyme
MADTNIAKDIVKLNADVATAFGVFLSGVDIRLLPPSLEMGLEY